MLPNRHNVREKPVEKRSSSGWLLQAAIILFAASIALTWQTPGYWAHKFMPSASPTKARNA